MPSNQIPDSAPQQPQTAPSPKDKLPEELRSHVQKEEASCAASGQECIAKLHGFIRPDAFPLQSDSKIQNKGFGKDDRAFLEKWLIDLKDDGYDVATAANLIESEAQAGRYPLVSLIGKDSKGRWGYHTFICAEYQKELLLIDPAKPEIILMGKTDIAAAFAQNSLDNPERKTIHILSYRLPAA